MAGMHVERVPETIFVDALMLLMDVLDLNRRLDDAAFEEMEEYGQGGDPVDRLIPAYGAGDPVPRSVVISAMGLFTTRWFDSGALQLYRLPPDPVFADDEDPQPDLATLACLCALRDLWFSDDDDREETKEEATDTFLALGSALQEGKRWSEAARAYAVAHNLAESPQRQAEAARRGARAAALGDSPDLAALHLVGLARALAEMSLATPADRGARAAAFTALEAAARHLRDAGNNRDEAERRLAGIAEALDDDIARALVWLAGDVPDEDDERGRLRRAMSLYTRPVWELDEQELVAAFPLIMSFVIDVEGRTGVPPDDDAVQLETSWTTGGFEHPSYRQAIPHGRTLFREGRLENVLFEIVHETTHVVSMLGGLGASALALRAATLELEATLWAHVPDAHKAVRSDDSDRSNGTTERGGHSPGAAGTDGEQRGQSDEDAGEGDDAERERVGLDASIVAPLTEHTALALAQAEQALEPVRCMRILQRVWTPWLEGVAAFTELASDPSEGDVSSLIGEVLANLVDAYVTEAESGVDVEALMKSRAETERLYTDLLATSARPRLRHYLGTRWWKYGPGYLAVRAVVANWRRTLGRPISGTEAARVLLHLTRYGTLDAVPDLGLGAHRFLPEAESAMVAWVRRAALMSRADLEYVLAPDGDWGWLGGRVLKQGEIELDDAESTRERFHALVRQAWSVHRGEDVDLDRVPDAEDECRYVMGLVAESLALAGQREWISDAVEAQLSVQTRLLPVGTLQAPFWLNRPTSTLVVPLRTTEMDKDHHGPGYDMEGLPLTREQAEALEREIGRRPGERLQVTRLVDLSPSAFRTMPVSGAHVIAYRLGTWLHVRPAGLLATMRAVPSDVIADVRERLVPSRRRDLEAELCEGVVAAGRTARWIEAADGWREGGHDIAIEAWARRVHRLAELVRDRNDEADLERGAASRLLTGLWGEAAEGVAREGIVGLTLGDSGRLRKFVDVLLTSAVNPGPSAWLDGLAPDDPIRSVMVENGGWDVRPLEEEST